MANTQTKRGDLVAFPLTHSATGVDFKVTRYTEWHLAVVTNITREGIATKAAKPLPRGGYAAVSLPDTGKLVVGADRLSASPDEIIESVGDAFDTIDTLRNAIRPFVKA